TEAVRAVGVDADGEVERPGRSYSHHAFRRREPRVHLRHSIHTHARRLLSQAFTRQGQPTQRPEGVPIRVDVRRDEDAAGCSDRRRGLLDGARGRGGDGGTGGRGDGEMGRPGEVTVSPSPRLPASPAAPLPAFPPPPYPVSPPPSAPLVPLCGSLT